MPSNLVTFKRGRWSIKQKSMRFSCLFNYEHLVNSTDHRIGVLMIPILKKYDETESWSGPQHQAPTSCPLGWIHFGFFRTQPVLRVRPPSVPSSGISRPSWSGYKYFPVQHWHLPISSHSRKQKSLQGHSGGVIIISTIRGIGIKWN